MDGYVGFVMALNLIVDLLLLVATNRLHGCRDPVSRVIPGAAIGSFYAGVCLLPISGMISGIPTRIAVLMSMGLVSYGFSVSAIHRSASFALLTLILGGITTGFDAATLPQTLIGILCVGVIWFLAANRGPVTNLVNMELFYKGKTMRVVALNDTGNGLQDPVTGESVIVVSPQIAYEFTGLTKEQLRQPTQALPLVPGSRLIPYKCVGCDSGLMLAIRFPRVKIGKNAGSALVAFAPGGFSKDGSFQALTGRRI